MQQQRKSEGAKLMNTMLQLSVSDKALISGEAAPDLPSQGPPLIRLLQPNSPELTPGAEEYLARAQAGDFGIPHEGERLLVKGGEGFRFQVIGFSRNFVEWLPDRGGFVAAYLDKPSAAHWLDAGMSKPGLYRTNGNKVEETIYCHMLTGGFGATYGFRSTALVVGRDLRDRAQRLKVEGEEIRGMILGKWLMTSRLERQAAYRWFRPSIALVGKFGDPPPKGPTLAEVRLAATLRKSFRGGLPWAPEPPAPPAETTLRRTPEASTLPPSEHPGSPQLRLDHQR
jgi:hypothetical protein